MGLWSAIAVSHFEPNFSCRMKESVVLLCDLSPTCTELARHLVLSGISLSLLVSDPNSTDSDVTLDDTQCDFLFSPSDVGQKVRSRVFLNLAFRNSRLWRKNSLKWTHSWKSSLTKTWTTIKKSAWFWVLLKISNRQQSSTRLSEICPKNQHFMDWTRQDSSALHSLTLETVRWRTSTLTVAAQRKFKKRRLLSQSLSKTSLKVSWAKLKS